MFKQTILNLLKREASRDPIFKKHYYRPLTEKVATMTETEIKSLVIETCVVHESVASILSLNAMKANECTKKCNTSSIVAFKRRMCYLECQIPVYKQTLMGLKREMARCGSNQQCREQYQKQITNLEKKIASMTLMLQRYKSSGFLKNAYINTARDWGNN
jgi:hypothetical protein